MGKHAYSRHELELRREKLFLRQNLVDKLESGELLGLEDFVSFIWHMHPNYVGDLTLKLLREIISARWRGEPYTQDDWIRFTKEMSGSKSSRDIVLSKLMYLGLVEKRNKTKMKYEIIVSDKWIQYLELMAQSWVMICENGSKVKR
jgi:hypothetical protein